ncbi:unnamed protein product [Brassicogethes aeneus]|uniref:C2H2-type domain-containing protein n=1 Tax=Brassicogethes aeneus TaxID=1431903 RepID=A0A9P0AR57_BRAAE|nr:unnamed protein product [Brassicogethes aeneus]
MTTTLNLYIYPCHRYAILCNIIFAEEKSDSSNKSRKYVRKCPGRRLCTVEQLEAAKKLIKKGHSQRKAASILGISESTLRKRLRLNFAATSLGRYRPTFSNAQEEEIYSYCKFNNDRICGLTLGKLRKIAYEFAEINKIENKFDKSKRMAGKDWAHGFIKRHPDLDIKPTVKGELLQLYTEYTPKRHICDICGISVTSVYSLRNHMRTHSGEKPFSCDFCGKAFTTMKSLKVHRRVHTKEKPFVCSVCNRGFSQSGSLQVHMRSHTAIFRWKDILLNQESEGQNYQCTICTEIFESKKQFLEHNMQLFGDLYTCCKCQESFKTCEELYEHHDSHIDENESIIFQSEDDNAFDGEVVEEEVEELILSYNEEEVNVQQAAHDANELLYILDDSQCVNEVVIQEEEPVVERRSENVAIVNLEHGYMIRSNLLHKPETVIQEEYEEDEAGGSIEILVDQDIGFNKSSPSTSKINQKPRTQLKRRHEVPDFSASNYDYINANDEIGVPHYKCLRCEQLFINKIVFFRHIEKGKCYINNCDVCSETFNKNSDFYLHYATEHTDRAICNFCFRTFMYEKNVKEHMLRHLDQFRHRCEECNKGFYTVREYRNHYKNRHMGIRHKCETCNRSFADEYYFKRHIATHAKANNITFVQIQEKS